MSLDVFLYSNDDDEEEREVYWRNITHNLGQMASHADIYYALWRPKEINAKKAKDIKPLLLDGITKLKVNPEYFRQFNASNGWGVYEHFLEFVEDYLQACTEYPEATISVSR